MSPGEPACPLILPVQKTETTSERRRVRYLKTLALVLFETLVVAYLFDKPSDIGAKLRFKRLATDTRVLDRVM
jgi:hypothetical protein